MRFDRYPPRIVETSTPQRLAAARRHVAAQREKFALFPEMAEDISAEARVEKVLVARAESHQERRDYVASQWRRARRELAALPPIVRAGVGAYWAKGILPGSHEYLIGIIAQAKRGASYWHKLADSRRYYLIARGRLPNPWRYSPPES